jgi:hypothetical protein
MYLAMLRCSIMRGVSECAHREFEGLVLRYEEWHAVSPKEMCILGPKAVSFQILGWRSLAIFYQSTVKNFSIVGLPVNRRLPQVAVSDCLIRLRGTLVPFGSLPALHALPSSVAIQSSYCVNCTAWCLSMQLRECRTAMYLQRGEVLFVVPEGIAVLNAATFQTR